MNETLYQNSISKTYITYDMKTTFYIHHKRPSFMILPLLSKIILKIIDDNIDKDYIYNGIGSMRRYATYGRNNLILDIKRYIDNKNRSLALEIIKNKSNMLIWMNSILYRPPNVDESILRYSTVKKSFENQVSSTV